MIRIPYSSSQDSAGVLGVGLDFFQEQPGWIRIPLEVGGTGQNPFKSRQDLSELFRIYLEHVGLVRCPLRTGRIGQNSFGRKWDWSDFLQG